MRRLIPGIIVVTSASIRAVVSLPGTDWACLRCSALPGDRDRHRSSAPSASGWSASARSLASPWRASRCPRRSTAASISRRRPVACSSSHFSSRACCCRAARCWRSPQPFLPGAIGRPRARRLMVGLSVRSGAAQPTCRSRSRPVPSGASRPPPAVSLAPDAGRDRHTGIRSTTVARPGSPGRRAARPRERVIGRTLAQVNLRGRPPTGATVLGGSPGSTEAYSCRPRKRGCGWVMSWRRGTHEAIEAAKARPLGPSAILTCARVGAQHAAPLRFTVLGAPRSAEQLRQV